MSLAIKVAAFTNSDISIRKYGSDLSGQPSLVDENCYLFLSILKSSNASESVHTDIEAIKVCFLQLSFLFFIRPRIYWEKSDILPKKGMDSKLS